MKQASTLFLLVFLLFFSHLYGQKIKGALIAGFNLTQVDGDEVYGFHKYGLNIGPSAILSLGPHWSVSMETLFDQKGSYQKPLTHDSASGEYRLQLDYVSVPFLLHYEDKDTWTFGLGLSWGKLINVKEYQHGSLVSSTTLDGPYSKTDWEILADVQFRIWKGFKFNARYAYTLSSIRTREFNNTLIRWTRQQYNNVITCRLIFVINDDSPPKVKSKNKKFRELQIPE